jgi:hypothetical protein
LVSFVDILKLYFVLGQSIDIPCLSTDNGAAVHDLPVNIPAVNLPADEVHQIEHIWNLSDSDSLSSDGESEDDVDDIHGIDNSLILTSVVLLFLKVSKGLSNNTIGLVIKMLKTTVK